MQFDTINTYRNNYVKDCVNNYPIQNNNHCHLLNWHVHLGVIPIPGTSTPNRMKENLNSIDFIMDEEDYNKLSCFEDKQYRFCDSLPLFGIDIFA